jgi:hypothetical protein
LVALKPAKDYGMNSTDIRSFGFYLYYSYSHLFSRFVKHKMSLPKKELMQSSSDDL